MKVLGIHAYIHDSGACLVSRGRVVAVSEERLDRVKRSAAFPHRSIRYVLDAFGIRDIHEMDLVVYDLFERQGDETLRDIRSLGYRGRIEGIRHHDAHAASAYFASPFDEAAVLVVDGAGSNGMEYPAGQPPHYLTGHFDWMQEVQSIFRGAGLDLNLIRRTFATPKHALGIGFLYGIACEYLGFDKLDGGKLMGLAAYGKKSARFRDPLFLDSDGHLLIPFDRERFLRNPFEYLKKKILHGTSFREPGCEITKSHQDIAFYVQQQTEAAMLRLAMQLHRISPSKNLCLAGGVALNGHANSLITGQAGFENVFIQPAASDSGIPLGCALYGYHLILGGKKRFHMEHAFLGRKYSTDEVNAAVKKFAREVRVSRPGDIMRHTAVAIAGGKIVGFFHGASEFGPRALGNRSILADPRRPDMKDILNRKVKLRESFRPYAPAVLEERAKEFFESADASPFMLRIVRVKPRKARFIPAALHVDGTARLQTVSPQTHPAFHSLIREFHGLTGIPMVINTSMNVSGEPIVETPEDAIRCLLNTGLDMLVMEDMALEKNSAT